MAIAQDGSGKVGDRHRLDDRDDGRDRARRTVGVRVLDGNRWTDREDVLAVEEPLEMRLAAGPPPAEPEPLALTMRTPGRPGDFELVTGFLKGEGVIGSADDIAHIGYCLEPDLDADQRYNVVTVTLAEDTVFDTRRLERHFYTSSACGVCGKAQLDQLSMRGIAPVGEGPTIEAATLHGLPDTLRAAQGVFRDTGGLHAAGLFDAEGDLLALREDVGRHNAVDKVVGWAVRTDALPLDGSVLMVSGRASFEILQKAVVAGIPMVAAVSAPSSLAVDVAQRFGVTLVGFLRDGRANVYAHPGRVAGGDGGSR